MFYFKVFMLIDTHDETFSQTFCSPPPRTEAGYFEMHLSQGFLGKKRSFKHFKIACPCINRDFIDIYVYWYIKIYYFLHQVFLGTDYLPSASTCVNLLKMPPYETIETLEMKLREAIETNTFENT